MLALLVYLNFALGWVALSERLSLFLAFAIGPMAIMGTRGLADRFAVTLPARTVRLGATYLTIAFSLLTLMLTVQQAVFFRYASLKAGRSSAQIPEALRQAFALVNEVQLGIDVAFDVFYALGVVVMSLAFLRGGTLARLVGGYGLLSGVGLLALNLWTFPVPPADAGLLDLGPATTLWWLGAFALDRRMARAGIGSQVRSSVSD